jgi:ferredoxin--NADP+ reductase
MSLSPPAPRPERDAIPLNLYRVSRPGIARVASNERLTPEGADDVRHVVLDLSGLDYRYIEGQSLGVLTPGADESGRPHKLRLYSIASTRLGDDGRGTSASLCVKRVVYRDDAGIEHRGVASNYLCDLAPGDEVAVTGPAGRTFLLPDDPSSNLVLIATGTGIAPFRAFLRRVYDETPGGWRGRVSLIFGVRTAADCLYRAEFERYLDRPGFAVSYAFSREHRAPDGGRLYVQHRLAESMAEVGPMLDLDATYLYLCGLKGMEAGIEAALQARAAAAGLDWPAWREALHKGGRLLVETY